MKKIDWGLVGYCCFLVVVLVMFVFALRNAI